MRRSVRFALFALVLKLACAQTQPDVSEILKKVSETYNAASNYQFVIDQTMQESGAGGSASFHVHIAFRSPSQYRLEGTLPGMTPFEDVLMVHDGSTLWFYLSKSNEYGSFPASALNRDGRGDLGDLRPEALDEFMMSRYRAVSDLAKGANLLREEPIPFGDGNVVCYVVSVSRKQGDGPSTLWVDKKGYRILREEGADSRIVFSSIKLDEPPPDELFKFTPPPGARKLEMHP